MVPTEPAVKPARRHGAALDEAIRQAVRDELADRGYADLTFEGVAKRARTSKPVIYRRYGSRAQMVLDAWIGPTSLDPVPESTGSLREDLRALGRAFSARFERIGVDTIRGLLAEVPPDQIHHLTEATSSWARDALAVVLAAASERGEIVIDRLPRRVIELPIVLVRNELLFSGDLAGGVLLERAIDESIDDICLPLLTAGAARPADETPGGDADAPAASTKDDRSSP